MHGCGGRRTFARGCEIGHHYLPWIVGFAFAVVVGHFAIKAAARQMWLAIDLNPDAPPLRPSPWQPEAVGLIERTLFTGAILTGNAGFVAVWLGLKTVGQWRSWGEGQESTTTKRIVSGREVYNNFLLGTGLSIGFAATGAYVTKALLAERFTPAALMAAAALLGTVALTAWIRHRGQRFLGRP